MRHLFFGMVIAIGCGPKQQIVHPMPKVGELPTFTAPKIEKDMLDNGLDIWLMKESKLPLIQLRLVFQANSGQDPEQRWGLNSLMMQMLDESAGGQSSAERSASFRDIAATYGSWASKSGNTISLRCHKKAFNSALALMAKSLTNPAFDQVDWDRVKNGHIDSIKQSRESERSVASIGGQALFYGQGHPLSHPTEGTPSSVAAIELEAIKALYSEAIKPKGATLIIAGDIDMATLKAALNKELTEWSGGDVTRVQPLQASPVVETKMVLIDSPGAAQTTIRGMAVGPNALSEESLPADLAAIVLGGSFTSRLNALLREKKGYTYGARAAFSGGHQESALIVSTSVRKNATTEAMTDILNTLKDMKKGLTETESQKAKSQMLNDLIGSKASLSGMVSSMHTRLIEGEAPAAWSKRISTYETIPLNEINQAAASLFNPEQMLFVLVGDVKTIRPKLESLNIPISDYQLPN